MVNHQGLTYRVWTYLINFLCFTSSFIYIHLAAISHERDDTWKLIYTIESMFLMDFLLCFITTYQDPLKPMDESIRDHEKIVQRYLKGDFNLDALALIPFWLLSLKMQRQRYFFVLKLVRLKKGLKKLDMDLILKWYKDEQKKQLDDLILKNPIRANSMDIDQTKIGDILMMGFLLKIMKIMIIISSCSYLFAMLFQLLVEIQGDLNNWDEFKPEYESYDEEPEHFVSYFSLEQG